MNIKQFTDSIRERLITFEIGLAEFTLPNMSELQWLEGLVIHVKEQVKKEERNGE